MTFTSNSSKYPSQPYSITSIQPPLRPLLPYSSTPLLHYSLTPASKNLYPNFFRSGRMGTLQSVRVRETVWWRERIRGFVLRSFFILLGSLFFFNTATNPFLYMLGNFKVGTKFSHI